MSKFGRQSDQILRPWTLDENFDQVIAQQCDELEKSLRRTSPFKQGGDYSYIQQRRFDNTDAVLAERFTPPSKIPAHIDLKPIKSKSTPKNIANDAASPNLLPYVAKYSPPSTLEQSTAKASKLGEASKHEEKQQMETRILNDHRNSYAVSNYTIPNEMIKSADLSLTTTFSATSRVKEIANHRHNNEIEDNLRMYSTMPPIASPELTESSSISGIVTKTKSMPNLMDFSSAVLDGIQDRERRADMYSTKRRELINHIHPSSPGEVNHEFYTQNLNQSQKVEVPILGRRKIKKMKSLEEHMMTSSGTQNLHMHPDVNASHRDEITHFAEVSRQMAADSKEKNTLDSTWNSISLHGFNDESNYISETNFAHTSNKEFLQSIIQTDKTQHIKIDTMSKWSRNAARNKVPIFTKGGTMKFN